MARIKQLVKTNELKTTYLEKVRSHILNLCYDDLSDTLMLLFVHPDQNTIVHYLDEFVAILYTPEDREIVGLQVDYFQSDFIPMYEDLQRAWCLSDFIIQNGCFHDLTLSVREKEISIALGIIKAKERVIGKSAQKFERALEYA